MKRGLGKGLGALFSIYENDEENLKVEGNEVSNKEEKVADNSSENSLVKNQGVVEIDIRKIDPNKNQPRKKFDANSLKELSESIKQHGVIQPIIVNECPNDRYIIIAGERRFRASIIAGLKTIPAIIKQYSPREIKEVALIENLQREDLNPIEAGKAIKELMEEYNFTQEEVADKIGKSRPLVANTLRLLNLCPEVIAFIENNQLSAGHGKCLVAVEDKEKQIELAKLVIENKLTVRDLEKLIRDGSSKLKPSQEKEKINQSVELKELGHRLQRLFRTKVKIVGDDKKGKISIAYFNTDDLDRICAFLDKLEK
jgi:ParB family transcriptional regulator, chromosome partitioning protein